MSPHRVLILAIDGVQREIEILRLPVRIGRDPMSHVHFTEPEVSRDHCRMLVRGNSWVVQNLSENGIWINGRLERGSDLFGLARETTLKVGNHAIGIVLLPDARGLDEGTAPIELHHTPVTLALKNRQAGRWSLSLIAPPGEASVPLPERLARAARLLMEQSAVVGETWSVVPLERELEGWATVDSMYRARSDLKAIWRDLRTEALRAGILDAAEIPEDLVNFIVNQGSQLCVPVHWSLKIIR